jgi:hypothetical protein
LQSAHFQTRQYCFPQEMLHASETFYPHHQEHHSEVKIH